MDVGYGLGTCINLIIYFKKSYFCGLKQFYVTKLSGEIIFVELGMTF